MDIELCYVALASANSRRIRSRTSGMINCRCASSFDDDEREMLRRSIVNDKATKRLAYEVNALALGDATHTVRALRRRNNVVDAQRERGKRKREEVVRSFYLCEITQDLHADSKQCERM